MSKNNNLVPTLLTRMNSMERKIDKLGVLLTSNKKFQPEIYSDFIKVPLNTLTKLYKYNNEYYRTNKAVLAALQLDKSPYGFSNNTPEYYHQFKVNIVYASEVFDTRYMMVCDGTLISKKTLKVNSNNWEPSVNITINGQQMTISKGILVYGLFIENDNDLNYKDLIYTDRDVANADVSNIEARQEFTL